MKAFLSTVIILSASIVVASSKECHHDVKSYVSELRGINHEEDCRTLGEYCLHPPMLINTDDEISTYEVIYEYNLTGISNDEFYSVAVDKNCKILYVDVL